MDNLAISSGPLFVRKRDNKTTQGFDIKKIERAIRSAWDAVRPGRANDVEISRVAAEVCRKLSGQEIADVENIQAEVGYALMDIDKGVAEAYIEYRTRRAAARETRLHPDSKALADYIHAAKYARYIPELNRREVFDETVDRVRLMHLKKFPQVRDDINWAFDMVQDKRVFPSMRAMQFAGEAVEKVHARQYNCSFTHINRPEAFSQSLYLLLCGSGVGFSVQDHHVDQLPRLAVIDENKPETIKVVHHAIQDSIEGWADALKVLIRGHIDGYYVEFDYSQIRAAGSVLKTSGGRAPGHLGLKKALELIRKILTGAGGRKLRPIEAYDIMCHAADAVLSGGIRRSAMIALFSFENKEMLNAKATEDWYSKAPWRQNTNNSVVAVRGEITLDQFKEIITSTRKWGEPGFLFVSDRNHGTNPCVPAGTRILTRDGYVAIDSRVDQPTVVWNGLEWRTVTPRITGYDQPLVRVHLSDGTALDCTDYHEWCIATGKWSRDHVEERVRAVDLEEGDTLMRYDMPLVENGDHMPYAYSHGFWCADGTIEDAGRKTAMCYGVKRDLIVRMEREGAVERVTDGSALERSRVVFTKNMPDKFYVPHTASVASRLEWLAGLLDGDGCVVKNPKSVGLQISSINISFLREVRLLLTTLGVQAKIGPMSDGGMRMLPDGQGDRAEYLTQPSFRIIINATDTHRLVRAGLRTSRLDLSAAEIRPQRDARRFVTVTAVERLAPAPVVYCFTEEANHTGTFEGIVTGQCAEIGLDPTLVVDSVNINSLAAAGLDVKIGDRLSGFAFCNLTEINAAKFRTLDDFRQAAKAASIIGTLQAAYTDFPYLGIVSEEIARRDALLGVSMTGMLDSPEVSCNPEYQREVAQVVLDTNKEMAAKLGINSAARATALKPAGTTSLAFGGTASGHHAHHARRYFRRVTANPLEPVFQYFKMHNEHMCVRKPNGDYSIEFVVEAPPGAIVKDDLTAIEFLEMVKSTQVNWVVPGTARTDVSPGLTHNVSNTVHVHEHEWDQVTEYLFDNQAYFTGVSLLPAFADKAYSFAPNEAITTEADENRWNQIVSNYTPVDYHQMVELEDGTALKGEAACAGGACVVS